MPPLLIQPPQPSPLISAYVLHAPPSKSLVLRGLVAAALAGEGALLGAAPAADQPLSDDVVVMLRALEALGVSVRHDGRDLHVKGRPVARKALTLDAGEGAAPARFLLALAATLDQAITVSGRGRLPRRPMAPLLTSLAELGVRVTGGPGLPATVCGPLRSGRTLVDVTRSSQYLSALMLVAATVEGGLELVTETKPVSAGYLDLTRRVLGAFGVSVLPDHSLSGTFKPGRLEIEADWSGATALLAASAFLQRPVEVPGLGRSSPQPDRLFLLLAAGLGMRFGEGASGLVAEGQPKGSGRFDLRGCPDAVPAFAALAALGQGEVEIRGVAHLADKESDRIAAIVALLRAVEVQAEALPDGLRIVGDGRLRAPHRSAVRVVTRGDHRMAMTAALLGLARPVLIDDAECVSKSFPGFFRQWPGVRRG